MTGCHLGVSYYNGDVSEIYVSGGMETVTLTFDFIENLRMEYVNSHYSLLILEQCPGRDPQDNSSFHVLM